MLRRTLCLAILALPLSATAQTAGDTYAAYPGEATPWPSAQPRPLQISRVERMSEGHRLLFFQISGGPVIELGDIGPYRVADPVPGTSLVFHDSRTETGYLYFTVFRRGEFLKKPGIDGQMGYAKALVLGARRDETVAIIEPPGSELPRKTILLGAKPTFLTSERTNKESKVVHRRTDYFLDVEEGLLVVSVVGRGDEHAYARQAAEDLMRGASVHE